MQFELNKEYISNLQELIKNENSKAVQELLTDVHAADIADILEELNSEERTYLRPFIEQEIMADAIVELDEETREEILDNLSSQEIAVTLEQLDSDDAADIINQLSDDQKKEVISHMEDVEQASDIVDLMHYGEDTAGGLMAKEYIQVNKDWNVLKCVKEMRKQAEQLQSVYTIYVVDDDNKLLGTLSLKKLLLAHANSKVENLYNEKIIYTKTSTNNVEVAQLMKKYDLIALPVVDELDRLVGRITIDDVVDVMQEESDKDYQMASGISQNVESTDKVWVLTKARLPWLLVGLFGGVCGAQVIGVYETDLKVYPEMAFFIPLIAAMGGNVGVQSSAIIVQGLANNTLQQSNMWSKLAKEFFVALINGLVCSALMFAFNYFMADSFGLSYTVSLSLIIVIIFAALFGTFVPLALDKYKIDPALATGPFITTMNDILGLFIYFGIGRVIYQMLA
jgi:magnesium transporter